MLAKHLCQSTGMTVAVEKYNLGSTLPSIVVNHNRSDSIFSYFLHIQQCHPSSPESCSIISHQCTTVQTVCLIVSDVVTDNAVVANCVK